MNMKQKIIQLVLLVFSTTSLWAGNASNVRVQQKDKDIIVTYDLSKTSNVRLLISIDDTEDDSFKPVSAVEGDVGKHVHAGNGLTIIWHPLRESETFIASNVRFRVEALGSYEQYALPLSRKGKLQGGKTNMETFITFDGGFGFVPQVSGGLTIGQTYKGIGWFVSGRTNFNFSSPTISKTAGYGGYVGDVLPFYTGQKQSSLFVANVGVVMDIIELAGFSPRNRFNTLGGYLGAGYGFRKMLWETIDGNRTKWIEYSPTSATGVSANFGVIGSIYGLTLKVGVNTIAFKYMELETSIGWMF